jgi:uncharacterized protein
VEPVRTCVACRGRESKTALIRLVSSDGSVVVDVRQVAPGRGAYLHPDRQCWEQALRRRVLPRVLTTALADPDRLMDELESVSSNRRGA